MNIKIIKEMIVDYISMILTAILIIIGIAYFVFSIGLLLDVFTMDGTNIMPLKYKMIFWIPFFIFIIWCLMGEYHSRCIHEYIKEKDKDEQRNKIAHGFLESIFYSLKSKELLKEGNKIVFKDVKDLDFKDYVIEITKTGLENGNSYIRYKLRKRKEDDKVIVFNQCKQEV